MNTDSTTKFQKKLGGVAINNMVISVNQLPDGTAVSAINDVSQNLKSYLPQHQILHLPKSDLTS